MSDYDDHRNRPDPDLEEARKFFAACRADEHDGKRKLTNSQCEAAMALAYLWRADHKGSPEQEGLYKLSPLAGSEFIGFGVRQYMDRFASLLNIHVTEPVRGGPTADDIRDEVNAQKKSLSRGLDLICCLVKSHTNIPYADGLYPLATIIQWFNNETGLFSVPWQMLLPVIVLPGVRSKWVPNKRLADMVADDPDVLIPLDGTIYSSRLTYSENTEKVPATITRLLECHATKIGRMQDGVWVPDSKFVQRRRPSLPGRDYSRATTTTTTYFLQTKNREDDEWQTSKKPYGSLDEAMSQYDGRALHAQVLVETCQRTVVPIPTEF